MRTEKRSSKSYVKAPNAIEAQIIRIVNRYFNEQKEKNPAVIESIIEEVILRLKTEHEEDYQEIFGEKPVFLDNKKQKNFLIEPKGFISYSPSNGIYITVNNSITVTDSGEYYIKGLAFSITSYIEFDRRVIVFKNLTNNVVDLNIQGVESYDVG